MHPLLGFLLGIIVILVVLYCVKLVLDYCELDAPLRKVIMLIVCLIALIFLVGLAMDALGGGGWGIIPHGRTVIVRE